MNDHEALIREARGWAEKIGNPFDRGEMTNAELIRAIDVFESAFDALEAASAERAVVEAQALEQAANDMERSWRYGLVGSSLDWLRARAVEIREGRQ